MATGMQINNIAIDQPMDERGLYLFETPVISQNGRGAATFAPYSTLTWQFDWLTKAEMLWWCNGILPDAASAEFTQCKLFNHLGVLTTYTHCVVYRPTYKYFRDGTLYEVTVVIDRIY